MSQLVLLLGHKCCCSRSGASFKSSYCHTTFRYRNRRPSDLYEKTFNRLRAHRRHTKGSDDIPLQSKSDLAYETMYDDDDIVDTAQTMPWFDPKYLATGRDEVSFA